MRRYDVISEICDYMEELGWNPYQNDHEDANGQFEMNWEYTDCLGTADRHAFFRFMVKSVAERHGLRATFMPKPFPHLTGNGCHAHVSVWDAAGERNLFLDEGDEMGLSRVAYHFLGGVLHHADALCSLFNPTVNSYKRINAPVTASGAHLVAERGELVRQQPHPHGADPGGGPLRAPPHGRGGEPVPASGRPPRRGPRRGRRGARPRAAPRHQHVYGRGPGCGG